MATEELSFTVSDFWFAADPEIEGFVPYTESATADFGDSSKFSSVEAKSSECCGLSIDRDSSVLKEITIRDVKVSFDENLHYVFP